MRGRQKGAIPALLADTISDHALHSSTSIVPATKAVMRGRQNGAIPAIEVVFQ